MFTVFHRDTASGLLSYVETRFDENGTDGVRNARAIGVSPDGMFVYVANGTPFGDEDLRTQRGNRGGDPSPHHPWDEGPADRGRDQPGRRQRRRIRLGCAPRAGPSRRAMRLSQPYAASSIHARPSESLRPRRVART